MQIIGKNKSGCISVLSVAKKLKTALEKNDFKTFLTRTGDSFLKLADRAEFAEKKKADLFISLHANANPSRSMKGFSVYTLSEKASDEEAQKKQHSIHSIDRKRTKKQFDQSINDKKQQKGKEAEQMVCNTLKQKYGEENVVWENGIAAITHNIIGHGDDSSGYDMKYKDKNGNWQYVEVKHASHANNNYYSFIITTNEENFCKKP